MPADWTTDPQTVLAILVMAGVTVLTRLGGFWLIQRMTLTPFLEAWLNALPGTVLVALVAPNLLAAGPAGWGAALVILAAALRFRNFLLALCLGMLSFIGLSGVV